MSNGSITPSNDVLALTKTACQEVEDELIIQRQARAALVEREIFHVPCSDYLRKYEEKILDVESRQNAINWIFKVQRAFFFFFSLLLCSLIDSFSLDLRPRFIFGYYLYSLHF